MTMTRILIVEDDPDIAHLVARYLEKAGYTTDHASTGREAWLWAAVPASLGSGFLVFIVARLATTPAGPHSAT